MRKKRLTSAAILIALAVFALAMANPATRVTTCHSTCEDAMMEFFEHCEATTPGDQCTVLANAFFCGCMRGCAPGEPALECGNSETLRRK